MKKILHFLSGLVKNFVYNMKRKQEGILDLILVLPEKNKRFRVRAIACCLVSSVNNRAVISILARQEEFQSKL